MDNSLPIVRNSGIRVQEGVKKTISEFQLKAVDADTNVSVSLLRNIQISKLIIKLYLVCRKTNKTILCVSAERGELFHHVPATSRGDREVERGPGDVIHHERHLQQRHQLPARREQFSVGQVK